jgi:hypothetical protein
VVKLFSEDQSNSNHAYDWMKILPEREPYMKKRYLLLLLVVLAGCSSTATEPTSTTITEAVVVSDEVEADQPRAEDTGAVTKEAMDAAETPTKAAAETVEDNDMVEPTESPVETELDHNRMLSELLFKVTSLAEGEALLEEIEQSGDTRFVAGLVDTLRYQPFVGSGRGVGDLTRAIGATLNSLTGEELQPDWFEWVEWAGQHPELESFETYPTWKGNLFSVLIDPQFARFVYADMNVAPDARVEEIVWGGVRVDGIPALDNPKMVDPEDADYLVPEERIFGVSINGDTRAYPARFLDWHEMFNDVVGGEPVSLAY